MTTRTVGGVTYTLTWTEENKLKQVTWPGNSVEFVYDGDSNRLIKIENGTKTLYQGNYYEKTGSVVTKYYYHNSERVAMRDGSGVYYFHNDHLGTASLTTKSTGQLRHQARQLPYGDTRWNSRDDTTDYDFTGQRRDALHRATGGYQCLTSVVCQLINLPPSNNGHCLRL